MAAQQNAIDISALDALYMRATNPVVVRLVTDILTFPRYTLSAVPVIFVITTGTVLNALLKVNVISLYELAGTVTPAENVRLSILRFILLKL